MKRTVTFLILLSLSMSFVGCVTYVFKDPKTISTQNIDPPSMKVVGKVSVKQSTIVLIIPIWFHDPRKLNDKLLDKAEAVGGNAVVNVQYNQDIFMIIPLFYKIDAQANGTAVLIE